MFGRMSWQRRLEGKLDAVLKMLYASATREVAMSKQLDEMNELLSEIVGSVGEVANDIDALIALASDADTPAEKQAVVDKLTTLRDNLKDVAAKYTPPAPVE